MDNKELLRICSATLRKIEVRGEYAEAIAGVINALDSIVNRPETTKNEESEVNG